MKKSEHWNQWKCEARLMTKYNRAEKIDYLSFSFPTGVTDFESREYHNTIFGMLVKYAVPLNEIFSGLDFVSGGGRKPYAYSWQNEYVSIFFHHRLSHGLVQIPGSGCAYFAQVGNLDRIIEIVKYSLTRIDFAVDIEVGYENRVQEFIEAGYSARFKSNALMVSESGVTANIGSRKSELFCRVYQYNPPNERANLLRVEIECKGDTAKRIAQAYLNSGLTPTINTLTAKYEFLSPLWQPDNYIMADIPARNGTKSAHDTVHWFYVQVKPAFWRLVEDGIVEDGEQFLQEVFFDKKRELPEGND
jgi:DNA relaxase NicK